jgi:hypothetical protein
MRCYAAPLDARPLPTTGCGDALRTVGRTLLWLLDVVVTDGFRWLDMALAGGSAAMAAPATAPTGMHHLVFDTDRA